MNTLGVRAYAWWRERKQFTVLRQATSTRCVCVCVRSLMYGNWSASRACIPAVKGAQATKALRWEESWDEEFVPEHRRRCVGISSKRISHLIKTSAQFQRVICYIRQLHANFTVLLHRKISASGGHASFYGSHYKTVFAYVLLMTWHHAECWSASHLPLKCITSVQNHSIRQWAPYESWAEGQ